MSCLDVHKFTLHKHLGDRAAMELAAIDQVHMEYNDLDELIQTFIALRYSSDGEAFA